MSQLDPELVAQARRVQPGEVPFDFSEMFFSRTDARGVIEAGNSVFCRVSGYEWDQMKGAPHKIVRHPDTPRGLFHLMWARLKAGETIGAYVKNRAQDGRHYWVFAVATPVDGGYASARIKPSSPIFEEVQALYADLVEKEAAGLTPEQSADLLQALLAEKGYASYDIFQGVALAAEAQYRARKLDRTPDLAHKRFAAMSTAIFDVARETAEMTEAFKAIRTVPMNMRILASRLENAGGPISAISVNYGSMLDEMATWVRTFMDGSDCAFARIRGAIVRGHFLTCVADVQVEMVAQLGRESGDRVEQDIAAFEAQSTLFKARATEALSVVEVEAARLSRSVLDMKRYVTGLSSTRMMCKIESATLGGSGDSLAGIVDQLDACQDEIESRLSRIVELNAVIQANTGMLRASA